MFQNCIQKLITLHLTLGLHLLVVGSSITFIDGGRGECYYRGYPMDVLAEKSNFLEVAYLLWYGELPSKTEWNEFSDAIKNHNGS